MIVEVAIGSALVALGVVALRTLRRRHSDPEVPGERESDGATSDRGSSTSRAPHPRGRPDQAPTFEVGDILLYRDHEYWLSGELRFEEGDYAFSLFPTPGSRDADFVLAIPEHPGEPGLLESTDVPDGALPIELPVQGRRLTVQRRGQATVTARGEHLPEYRAQADFAHFGDSGGSILVVVDFEDGPRISLFGERLQERMFDRLPGS